MSGWKHFGEIVAWQLAYELKSLADTFLDRPDFKKRYKLHDQLSDACRSGPRNIAEGFGRFNNKEFAHFTRIAKASETEVLNHLIDARDLGLISAAEFETSSRLTERAISAAVGLIQHLERNPAPRRPRNRTQSGEPD